MIRIFCQQGKNLRLFHVKYPIQPNDTHPVIGVAEWVRLPVDDHGFGREDAWRSSARSTGELLSQAAGLAAGSLADFLVRPPGGQADEQDADRPGAEKAGGLFEQSGGPRG